VKDGDNSMKAKIRAKVGREKKGKSNMSKWYLCSYKTRYIITSSAEIKRGEMRIKIMPVIILCFNFWK
jgi:hypothetical protein